ncbi:MAG TPA: creatininase, partial [Dehalococcoidia bacterium]|nr:creatininase [Dehalococcoidia bacterium]
EGPVSVISWTSEHTDSGICGDALLASPEKGKLLFEEAVKNLIVWSDEFYSREVLTRKDHHTTQPLSDLPG